MSLRNRKPKAFKTKSAVRRLWTGKILVLYMGASMAMSTLCYGACVTDQLGRRVDVKKNVQRVVALAPSITEIVFALGQGHRVCGVTRFSNYPPEVQTVPRLGSYIHPDLEKIVALRPDLCIAVKDGNPREIALSLESLHIPVYAVNPTDLETVMETILDIGELLHSMDEALALVQDMRMRIRTVKERVARIGHRPDVFFQIGISPIVSVGSDTFAHELIDIAGGRNLSEGATAYPRFSMEQVIGLAPDVLIITSMARGRDFERVKSQWSLWPELPAVKSGRIAVVNSDLFDRPTPRLIDGLELLSALIHPELVEDASESSGKPLR